MLKKLIKGIWPVLVSMGLFFSLMATPAIVTAQPAGDPADATASTSVDEACAAIEALGGTCDETAQSSVTSVVKTVLNVMSFIVGIIAVIMLVVAGIRFMTSGGDPQATSGARNTILYAVIGIVIVIMAQVIIAFVLNKVKTDSATPTVTPAP